MNVQTAFCAGLGITKRYGSQVALDDVDFHVLRGEVVGLLGANGAGKSTLLKVLAGATRPDAGEIILEGQPIHVRSMPDAQRKGIALVSQELNLFPSLTVLENLLIPMGRLFLRASIREQDRFRSMLADLGFEADLQARVANLPIGDRQLVEIARAMLQSPRLLIFDEPTSALKHAEKQRLKGVIRRLREHKVAMVYTTHFLEEAIEIVDRFFVLRDGRHVDVDLTASRDKLSDLVRAMYGDQDPEQQSARDASQSGRPGGPTVQETETRPLRIVGLKGLVKLDVEELAVEPGEIVGLAGLAGSGIGELFALLFGRLAPRTGTIELPSGRPRLRTIPEAVAAGVAYIPADRRQYGLMLRDSVAENIASVRSLTLGRDGIVRSRAKFEQYSRERAKRLGIALQSIRQTAATLSGGNQQKVVFAKWLEADPSLLLLDDPTRGIDVRARQALHQIIKDLARAGRVILFYSSDPSEVVEIADRVAIFVDGQLAWQISGSDKTEHNVVTLMNTNKGALPSERR